MTAPDPRRSLSLGRLRDADREGAVGVLARAFRDNPLNVAVVGEGDTDKRLRANLHGMRALLPVALAHGNVLVARTSERVAGALISAPPSAYPLPAPPLLRRLRCLLGQGWGVATRWAQVFDVLQGYHPDELHWYLGTLGVEPTLQGRGVGSALLERWLEQVDREGIPAYLETDVFANVHFYGRAGFEVEGTAEIFGAPVWRMRRPPARA